MKAKSLGMAIAILTLAASAAAQSINVTYPDANVTVAARASLTVKWKAYGSMEKLVNITLMHGQVEQPGYYAKRLVTNVPNDGEETIIVPNVVSNLYYLQVATNNSPVYGNSQTFRIVALPGGNQPPTQPDLLVCLEWDGERPLINQNKLVTARIINKGGSASAACTLEVYVEGLGSATFAIPGIAPAAEYVWQHKFSWPTMGHKTISATIDSTKVVAESNETNNYAKAVMSVRLATMDKYVAETKVCSDIK
jgi:hypothetical protein